MTGKAFACERAGRAASDVLSNAKIVIETESLVAVEAASVTAGARPKARSASMAARLPCIARGCAASTATNLPLPTWTAAQAED